MDELFRYHDKLLVRFRFVMQIGNEKHEVRGVKTLKLFRSWFRLACNWQYKYTPKNRQRKMLYGYVEFASGEKWIWQNRSEVFRGGWQLLVSEQSATIKREERMEMIRQKREQKLEDEQIKENNRYFDKLVNDMFSIF